MISALSAFLRFLLMTQDFSYGIIPIHETPSGRQYLIVQHLGGHWSFPKGHPKTGESELAAARRELAEETAIVDCRVLEQPRFEEHYEYVKRRTGKRIMKTVVYFIGYTDHLEVQVPADELRDHAWGDADATAARLTYEEGRRLLREVETWLDRENDE